MMDWERIKLKYMLNNFISQLKTGIEKEIDLTKIDVCPANIITVLEEELGFEELDFDVNGWQNDTWYSFEHPETKEKITLFYSGYLFELKLMLPED